MSLCKRTMSKENLSLTTVYKNSATFKKFIEESKQKLLKSIFTDKGNKISLTTLLTNDKECKISEKLQMYEHVCDYFKVMNSKEATKSTICDDDFSIHIDKHDDVDVDASTDGDNKQSVAKSSCYASTLTDNGSDKVDVANNVSDCSDDTNNHSNNNGNNKRSTRTAINDNNTSVASKANNSSNKQILNKKVIAKLGIKIKTRVTNKKHHKLFSNRNDTDGRDHGDENDNEDNNNDNCNVEYKKHHKTCETHESRRIMASSHEHSCMPLKIKQEHSDLFPIFSSSKSSTAKNSSLAASPSLSSTSLPFENVKHHKIKNCEIHQQPTLGHIQKSIVQQLGTFVSNYGVGVNYGQKSTGGEREKINSVSKCELASPRCQSRESTASASANNDVRCPSNESHYSGHEGHTPGETPTPTSPSVGLPLPATLAPAAAAALLPPQSAAMAAYFNAAAAAAAQQNHLLLTNPLAAAASLVQQATQQQVGHSPNSQQTLTPTPPNANDLVDTSALDFSTKRSRRNSEDYANGSEEDEDNADIDRNDNVADNANDNEADDLNSPLDLSVNNGRKRQSDEEEPVVITNRKLARSNDYKSLPASSTWVPPINPYLAAVAAANMSPKTPLSLDWNAKTKIVPNEATKALEKMTEMTRLGGSAKSEHNETSTRHSTSSTSTSAATTTTTSNGRHSAWQSHWLNKGADAVKDVFKCVWCKQSFATLASLTTHMKETQHCGVNVPPNVGSNNATTNSGGNQATQSSHHSRHSTTQSSGTAAATAQQTAITANNSTTSGGSKSDLNMLIKETMPLPRKLVRGQDVWLGKGAEQTRQILKCMWCGQSFRSLAEMTSHMQETQHYTNIISQEQIISWKSTDEKTSRDNSSGSNSSNRTSSNSAANHNNNNSSNAAALTANNSAVSPTHNVANSNATISAVLTCKVCDQAFSTLKELSNHMMKNNHYKEHMMRTAAATENLPTMIRGRGRQTREKRKKSLPVRKLLEMERAQHDFKAAGLDQALKPLRDFAVSTKLACETCGDKVETAMFVDHIRQCIDRSLVLSPRSQNNNNNTLKSPYGHLTPQDRLNSPQTPHSQSDGRKTSEGNSSPLLSNNIKADILCPLPPIESEKTPGGTSVLNALEQLIEKSFDSRPRHSSGFGEGSSCGTPLGSSILKRLGIDDNVDYTKPLMDPQTMQFLRSYSNYPSNRDRSASESSSVSERCSSRLESFTPERSHDLSRQPTPRLTPEKTYQNMKETRDNLYSTKIKSEPIDSSDHQNDTDIPINEIPKKISVKKEFNIPEDHEEMESHKMKENDMRHNSLTPSSRAISPSISERSITPKSTCSSIEKKHHLGFTESSSLNALSSMFNNLNNTNNTTISSGNMETNNNNTATTMAKKTSANPLAALQKLCETTDTPAANTRSSSSNNNLPMHTASSSSSSSTTTSITSGAGSGSGTGSSSNASMLAFSWACNDAVVTADSIIKCSFCDTPFSSKGAYRHHLSKVHFVKDEQQHYDLNSMKSPVGLIAISPKSLTSPKSIASAQSPATQQRLEPTPPSSIVPTPTINPYDESPQSKFLKYTELAKQLSSKNA